MKPVHGMGFVVLKNNEVNKIHKWCQGRTVDPDCYFLSCSYPLPFLDESGLSLD
ncbi:MAG: hypothetical protein QOI77_1985 [Blastocatellia bacterium]|nr:hypothetical protein [Blastocatellia bacterium]